VGFTDDATTHRYINDWIKPAQAANELGLCAAQSAAVTALSKTVPNLHYASGVGKLGDDPAVASESSGGIGVHPSTLAHLAIGEYVAGKVAQIISGH
jgi:hypothetical protein